MASSRVRRSAALLMMGVLLPVFASAQGKNDKNQKKQDEARRAQYLALAKTVDTAMATPPAVAGVKLVSSFSLKAQENKTYVPFTLSIDPTKLNAGTAVVYMRVAQKGATPPAVEEKKDDKNAAPTFYPFDDLYTVQLKAPAAGQPYTVSRAFAVPGGEYDIYVAVAEQTGE